MNLGSALREVRRCEEAIAALTAAATIFRGRSGTGTAKVRRWPALAPPSPQTRTRHGAGLACADAEFNRQTTRLGERFPLFVLGSPCETGAN